MSSSGSDPTERYRQLLGVALEALVADHAPHDDPPKDDHGLRGSSAVVTAFGAAVSAGPDNGSAWVMLDSRERDPAKLLGAVMAWAVRAEVTDLRIISDEASPTLARRAAEWDLAVTTWVRSGRSVTQLLPAPLDPVRDPDPRHLEFGEIITAAGATLFIEHGVVTGEVRGLEVCRVVDDAQGMARLEVGVGANDRLTFSMLHEGEPVEVSLSRVVGEVTAHRSVGARRHPLNQLAKERFLRWYLTQSPELVGAVHLEPVPGPVPRSGLMEATACSAVGRDRDGRSLLLVCSVGIDLDLVPYAIDARLREASIDRSVDMGEYQPESHRLVIAVPSRDLIALQMDLAARISGRDQWAQPELIGVDWPDS